jgi:hypothetical protein
LANRREANAAGQLARKPPHGIRSARLTFAMARHAVVDMCAVFRLKPTPPPANRLPPEEEQHLESFLAAGGVPLEAAPMARAPS